MKHRLRIFVIVLAAFGKSFGQPPVVTAGGVVNAASGSSPVAPGSLVAIYGTNLAATIVLADAPLPPTLGGTSVMIDGIAAPLAFVSPTQINAQVPSGLSASPGAVRTARVIVTTHAGTGTPAALALTPATPGFFTADANGCGPAAALNVAPFRVSLNSPSTSAAPGDYIALFGTGFGIAVRQPPDGTAPADPSALQTQPGILLDNTPVIPSYSGLAPSLVGVDQINFQIPANTRNGCAVPILASGTLPSQLVTVSVQKGGGQCVDPPIRSYGSITLTKFTFSGPLSTSPASINEGFSAQFPSEPALQAPVPETIVLAPDFAPVTNLIGAAFLSSDGAPINLRSCPVPGYTHLSAGAMRLQPPSGDPVLPQGFPFGDGGIIYSQSLPAGFVVPGVYRIAGSPGAPVTLDTTVSVGSTITLQTAFPAGTALSASQPITLKWTGGDQGSLVRFSLISGQGTSAKAIYSYADATSGSLILPASLGLPLSANAQISISVAPAPDRVTTVSLPGLTDPLRIVWQYGFTFTGLSIVP